MVQQYQWADFLVLPTLCEGSANVCFEAMSTGLSVITTPNAGSVVRDGVDGFVVPIRDCDSLSDRMATLIGDSRRREKMGLNAWTRVQEFSRESYGERLGRLIRDIL
jgi:glycosyltransferase involved in cell wall biosynthesis